jgi:hypothetical protein
MFLGGLLACNMMHLIRHVGHDVDQVKAGPAAEKALLLMLTSPTFNSRTGPPKRQGHRCTPSPLVPPPLSGGLLACNIMPLIRHVQHHVDQVKVGQSCSWEELCS